MNALSRPIRHLELTVNPNEATFRITIPYPILLLLLIILFPSLVIPKVYATTIDRRIQGYDCAKPVAVQDHALDETLQLCQENAKVARQENVTFQLLYKEPLQRLKGYRCEILDTRTVHYCGKYSHQTSFARYNYADLPKPPTAVSCRSMVRYKKLQLPDGEEKDLKIGAQHRFYYTEVGRTYTGSDWIYPDLQVQCQGGDWRMNRVDYKNMIVEHHWTVTVTEEEFIYDGKRLVAVGNNVQLNANVFDTDTSDGDATYTWESPIGYCPITVSKVVTGLLVEDEHTKTKVFMSTDNSLVRLVMSFHESYCGRMIWATNYPDLFLGTMDTQMPFERRVDPKAISMTTYVKARDDFLYNHVLYKIEEELGNVLMHNCKQREAKRKAQFYIQHKNPDMITYGFGNGTFATSSGEVLYYHKCRPEIVTASDSPYCYDALPVHLPMDSPLHRQFNASQWFVEPLTRRLTRYASILPCTKGFGAKYKGLSGKWMSANPTLHLTDSPKPMEDPETVITRLLPDVDFSKGGIYDDEDMKAWEAFTMIGRIRQAVLAPITQDITDDYTRGATDPLVQTPSDWFKSKLNSALGFLTGLGSWASLLVGGFTVFKICTSLFSWLYGCKQIRQQNQACSWALLWTFCPAGLLLRDFRRRGPPAPAPGKDGDDDDDEDGQEMACMVPDLSRRPSRASRPSSVHFEDENVGRQRYAPLPAVDNRQRAAQGLQQVGGYIRDAADTLLSLNRQPPAASQPPPTFEQAQQHPRPPPHHHQQQPAYYHSSSLEESPGVHRDLPSGRPAQPPPPARPDQTVLDC